MNPERLFWAGSLHPGAYIRRAWWIEPLAAAIAVVVVGGVIGFALFVVAR